MLIGMQRVLLGAAVAAILAASVSGAAIFGIAVWKIALAGVGLVIFIMGSDRRAR